MSTEQREFDSHKYVALVYNEVGQVIHRVESDNKDDAIHQAQQAYTRCVEYAESIGVNSSLPIWDTYTRDRDVRKLVEEAYARGLAEGKAAQ